MRIESYKNKSMGFDVNITDVEVEINVKTQSYQMYSPNSTGKTGFRHFHGGDGGYTLKLHCITRDTEKTNNKLNLENLHDLYLKQEAVNITSKSEAIKNGIYDISKFESYTLLRKNVYEFDIELTTYTPITTKVVNKISVLRNEFIKQCPNRPSKKQRTIYTASDIKNKKAKVYPCIQKLNKILYKKGFMSKTAYKKYGDYNTKYTKKGLSKFGKKWNKKGLKPKVNEKGKISKKIWEALKNYNKI